MKTVAIVQARMGSTRLPGKVLSDIGGRMMIEILLDRLATATLIDEIVVATSTSPENDKLAAACEAVGVSVFRGDERDVLGRFHAAARVVEADVVVRITGDCPLVDGEIVDATVSRLLKTGADYASNVAPATFPDGLDVEAFTRAALATAAEEATSPFEREHVTPYLRGPRFRQATLENDADLSALRWTVDDPADLTVIRAVFAHFSPEVRFSWTRVLELKSAHPELFEANQGSSRNEGAFMGTGQKLWTRAKRVIPGGNMLLSKRAEMFLPDAWPAYFSRTKGASVWDMDGNEYLDLSLMGIGTNTLGYSHPEVDAAVRKVIDDGNMSTFNAPEEVYLAERLVELHPWSDMVRFARSGGEANSIAVRIARAASGRDNVAICGYHGWHDWYLSTNLADDEGLDGHLLPGLSPTGVPSVLRGTTIPFNYNDFDALVRIVDEHNIGTIKMEVSRNTGPENGFLQRVRELATARGIVLIFDECTSGFRQTYGGLHKLYGVEPDLAVFGKTLGNGYAVTAVIGRREVMEAAQSTFISSTFWTERIGSVAALKTLEVMAQTRSWEQITTTGLRVRDGWQSLADEQGLGIDHWGLPALAGFTFRSPNAQAYKTIITQEMLKKGYLAGNSLYSSIAHTPDMVDQFFEELRPVFGTISEVESGRPLESVLDGPIAHSGFKRLN